MNSIVIGIARTGTSNNHVLNEDTRYISMCGSKPEVSFTIKYGQDVFLEKIRDLRYDDPDPSSSKKAISFFQSMATQLFDDLRYLQIDEKSSAPLHIRLVTTPLELAQIPFEFVLAPKSIAGDESLPLLTLPKRIISLTREIRQEREDRYVWPEIPRILFVWAEPSDPVPHEQHAEVLLRSLHVLVKPIDNMAYPQPDYTPFITELPHASLQMIRKTMREGILEKRPYTHIHILCHGGHEAGMAGFEFRILLCKDGSKDEVERVNGPKLVDAISDGKPENVPTIVSLMACDGGNVGNTIISSGGVVHELHRAGIPCVFASQFPLTKSGSVKLADILYRELINGGDPREILYNGRMEVKSSQNHDWASLVAYARFPEDINAQLQDVKLKIQFAAMRTTNSWVDHVFKYKEKIPLENRKQALTILNNRLDQSIAELSKFLNKENDKESALAEPLRDEHLGLLGSAYKRKAEYLFRQIEFSPESKDELSNQSTEALIKAKDFYKCGFDANANSHWNAMQYLSLKLVLTGSLKDEADGEIWTLIKHMAQRQESKAKKYSDKVWAWGTLAELYMLKPCTLQNPSREEIDLATNTAKDYIVKMASEGIEFNFAKDSTARQFERYLLWWPRLLGATFPTSIIKSATEIRGILPPLDQLL